MTRQTAWLCPSLDPAISIDQTNIQNNDDSGPRKKPPAANSSRVFRAIVYRGRTCRAHSCGRHLSTTEMQQRVCSRTSTMVTTQTYKQSMRFLQRLRCRCIWTAPRVIFSTASVATGMQSTALILDEISIGRATHFITLPRRRRRQRPLGGTPQLLRDTLQRLRGGGALLAVPTRVPGHCPLSPTGINSSVSHHPTLNSTWTGSHSFAATIDQLRKVREKRKQNRKHARFGIVHRLSLARSCFVSSLVWPALHPRLSDGVDSKTLASLASTSVLQSKDCMKR
jgi:hypothetical protein